MNKKRAVGILAIISTIIILITGGEQQYTQFLPNVRLQNNCGPIHPKRAIALAYGWLGHYPAKLCLDPNGLYHRWSHYYGLDENGTRVSMVWSHVNLGWDYVAEWKTVVSSNYTGFVLWANEPDRPDQADLTTAQLVTMFINISTYCPNCKFIGPMYSNADDGTKLKQFITACNANSNCNLNKIYAWSLHVYPRPAKNWTPSQRVDDLCNIIGTIYCSNRKVWLTEIGYVKGYATPYSTFYNWIVNAQNDPQIEKIFLYTTFQESSSPFHGALVWGDTDLTDIGRAWRDANLPQPYP